MYSCPESEQNHNTQDSRVVPHRGTNWAALWLTAQIGRDAVLSESYGRGCRLWFVLCKVRLFLEKNGELLVVFNPKAFILLFHKGSNFFQGAKCVTHRRWCLPATGFRSPRSCLPLFLLPSIKVEVFQKCACSKDLPLITCTERKRKSSTMVEHIYRTWA